MALIGNYSIFNRFARTQFGGGVSSNYRDCFYSPAAQHNRLYGGYSQTSATPNGYLAPGAFVLPMKSGGMSSYVNSSGQISRQLAQLYAGRNLQGTANSSIVVTNAQLDQIVALVAAAILSIVTTNAGLSAAVGMSATGTQELSVFSAQLGGIFDVSAMGTMTLTPTVVLSALAFMEAEAGGPTPLSPEGLAAAVWAANIADNTDSGTMGSLLLASGGGSSPEVIAAAVWDELMTTHSVSGTYGERVQKLLTVSKFLGLK